jgi:chitinase
MSAVQAQYYSPYVDVTLYSPYDLTTLASGSGLTSFTLAFIESSGVNPTTHVPTIAWGGDPTFANSARDVALTAEVQTLKASGTITIAFGGQFGTDPAVAADTYYQYLVSTGESATAATNDAALMLAGQYQSVINQYGVNHLDFDIEGTASVDNVNADHLRNLAIKTLEANSANAGLRVSFTLPAGTTGLLNEPQSGNGNVLNVLNQAATDGVKIDVVNITAMEFGVPSANVESEAESAANGVHAQVVTAGLLSNTAGSPTKIGVTAEVGLNFDGSTFSIANAQALESWAAQQSWVAGLGIWSMARDQEGTPGTYGPLGSGVAQSPYDFSHILDQITVGGGGGGGNGPLIATSANQNFVGAASNSFTVDYSVNATAGVTVDLAKTTVQTQPAAAHIGAGTLTSIDNLIGSNFDDHLYGNGNANSLTGNDGNDILDGRGGADTMIGGAGNDVYYVDNPNDIVTEAVGGGTTDKVYTSVSYTLDPNTEVEYLYANYSGTTGITLTGNQYSHHIYGGAGADHLIGGAATISSTVKAAPTPWPAATATTPITSTTSTMSLSKEPVAAPSTRSTPASNTRSAPPYKSNTCMPIRTTASCWLETAIAITSMVAPATTSLKAATATTSSMAKAVSTRCWAVPAATLTSSATALTP